jgi:hypothetical protein
MSGIMPELIPRSGQLKERRAAYPPGTAKENSLDSRFTVSVAWRPE